MQESKDDSREDLSSAHPPTDSAAPAVGDASLSWLARPTLSFRASKSAGQDPWSVYGSLRPGHDLPEWNAEKDEAYQSALAATRALEAASALAACTNGCGALLRPPTQSDHDELCALATLSCSVCDTPIQRQAWPGHTLVCPRWTLACFGRDQCGGNWVARPRSQGDRERSRLRSPVAHWVATLVDGGVSPSDRKMNDPRSSRAGNLLAVAEMQRRIKSYYAAPVRPNDPCDLCAAADDDGGVAAVGAASRHFALHRLQRDRADKAAMSFLGSSDLRVDSCPSCRVRMVVCPAASSPSSASAGGPLLASLAPQRPIPYSRFPYTVSEGGEAPERRDHYMHHVKEHVWTNERVQQHLEECAGRRAEREQIALEGNAAAEASAASAATAAAASAAFVVCDVHSGLPFDERDSGSFRFQPRHADIVISEISSDPADTSASAASSSASASAAASSSVDRRVLPALPGGSVSLRFDWHQLLLQCLLYDLGLYSSEAEVRANPSGSSFARLRWSRELFERGASISDLLLQYTNPDPHSQALSVSAERRKGCRLMTSTQRSTVDAVSMSERLAAVQRLAWLRFSVR